MKGHIVYALAFGILALILTIGMVVPVQAQDLDRDRLHTREQIYPNGRPSMDDGPIYGRQLMSVQEQEEYRSRMRSLSSEEERERLRQEHHRMMQERAKALGITLPDEPPERGMGRGYGPGGGTGMGPGGGMGGRQ